jgi:hypothetical protein
MNWNAAFVRKIVYLGAIVVLLAPISLLGQPATAPRGASGAVKSDPGGLLARIRARHQLALSSLGEIDPASATMNFALVGMRGVAGTILWNQANYYKMTQDWDSLKATLNQLSKIQPHFVEVWRFQAWNLSYNVSVEFDDYRDRFHWVKKGIEFFIDGTRYNRGEPRMYDEIGWFFCHKIGRADEYRQYRRLFREDDDFHNLLRPHLPTFDPESYGADGSRPDSWKVGWLWQIKAQDLVDSGRAVVRGKSPLIFHSDPPMSLMNYAIAIEGEGILDEKAQYAWMRAGQAWHAYGERQLPSQEGFFVRLNDEERLAGQVPELRGQLDALAPNTRDQLSAERRKNLTADEIAAVDTPLEDRTPELRHLAYTGGQKLVVTDEEVARRAPPARQPEAFRLAARLADLERQLRVIRTYRQIVNFEYWRTRAEIEQTDAAIRARKLVVEADDLVLKDANLVAARAKYEQAWDEWAGIFDKYPVMLEDVVAEDLVASIARYRSLLDQFSETLPADFKLRKLLEAQHRDWLPKPDAPPPPAGEKPAATEAVP